MNHFCKIILQDPALQKFLIMSSGCTLKVSKIIPKELISHPAAGYCSGCGKDVIAQTRILYQERGIQHFVSSVTRWVLLGRPAFTQIGIFKKLQTVSGPHSLSDNSSTLGQTFRTSRNYSTTSRIFSEATVASSAASIATSAIPSTPIASPLAIPSVEASTSSGLLFPDFFSIYGAERAIEYIHQLTGLSWWSTIVLTAFIMRVVVMAPLTVHSFHNMARLQKLQPEVKEKAEKLKMEVGMAMHQFRWTQKRAKEEYRKKIKHLLTDLYIRDNCHPLKGVAVFWVQIPVWISVSYALRNMSLIALNPNMDGHMNLKDLSEQGLAWFSDLTVTDSTWLLPVMMGAVTLFNIEMNYLTIPEVTRYRKWLTYVLRSVALIFIPICATMPCSMVLYWVSSGTFAAVQNLLFDYSPFRRLVRLPQSRTESHSPVLALTQKAKARYWKM